MPTFRLTAAAVAGGALLLLGACSPMATAPIASAPSATRPNSPLQDTGNMAYPAPNPAGSVTTRTY